MYDADDGLAAVEADGGDEIMRGGERVLYAGGEVRFQRLGDDVGTY